MTFGEHLEELRWRLFKAILSIAIGFAAAFYFRDTIMAFFVRPYLLAARWEGASQYLIALHPTEVFMVVLKICALVGVIVASPYAFYQIWAFVATGLYPRERSLVTRMVPFSVALFAIGVAFLFYIVLPIALRVLLSMNSWVPIPNAQPNRVVSLLMGPRAAITTASTQPQADFPKVPILDEDPANPPPMAFWINQNEAKLKIALDAKRILVSDLHLTDASMVESRFALSEYVSFATGLAFGFGIGFQVPLVVVLLSRIGIVSAAQMAAARKFVILGAVVAGACLTPTPDMYNQMLLTVPMIVLFEIGLVIARFTEKRYAPLRQARQDNNGDPR